VSNPNSSAARLTLLTKTPIIWHNETVGFIEDMKAEMFELYGKWLPLNTPTAQDFLSAVEIGEDILVQVGTQEPKLMRIVEAEFFHGDKISIRMQFRK
jgi:hypothetical protein